MCRASCPCPTWRRPGASPASVADVITACSEAPQCAADLLMILFRRKLDRHQTTFAMGESIAHLHALWLDGRLTRRLDADGVYRFSVA